MKPPKPSDHFDQVRSEMSMRFNDFMDVFPQLWCVFNTLSLEERGLFLQDLDEYVAFLQRCRTSTRAQSSTKH